VTAPAHALAPLERFSVSATTVNRGRARARRSTVGFYLSRDPRHDGRDLGLGRRAVPALRAGAWSTGRKRLSLPPGVAAGRYRLIACADVLRQTHESSRRNDCRAATQVVRVSLQQPAATPVTLSAPVDGTATSDSTPLLAGHAAPAALVTVRVFAGLTEIQTLQAMPAADGAWSVESPPLTDGAYTVLAEQTDDLGRVSRSDGHGFTVDTVAPAVGLATPADGTLEGSATPALSGPAGTATGDDGTVTVRLWAGTSASGDPVQTLSASASSGAWSTAPAPLPDGTFTAEAEQRDAAGNSGHSASHTFQVDQTGPTVNLVSPADGAIVNVAATPFSGTAGDAAGDTDTVTVKVRDVPSGNLVRTRTATRTGTSWSIAASPPLADGSYTAQAEQLDAASNAGTSAPHQFTVDTSGPAVAIDAPPPFTNDTTPTFTGARGTAAGDAAAVTVKVYDGVGTLVRTLPATVTGGSWSATVDVALAPGAYSVEAEQADTAGNTGKSSKPGFEVDTSAPAVSIAHPLAGSTIGNVPPTFDGSAGDAASDSATVTVKLYTGATATGTPVTFSTTRTGSSWSVTLGSPLSSGTYTAVAEQEDAAGNPGASPARTFQVDATPPAVTLVNPADGVVTADTTPNFSGAAGTAAGDTAAVSVKVYAGSSASGSPIQTIPATASSGSWGPVTGSSLGEGTYTAQAEQSDSSGNVGRSAANTFKVDTTDPTLSLTLTPASPNGQNGWYVTMPTAHVVADDPNFGTLSCEVDGAAGSLTPTPGSPHDAEGEVQVSGEGSHTVQCTADDDAGNSTTTSKTFKVDSVAPTVALGQPASGATTASMTFDGTAGTASGDDTAVTVRVYPGSGTSNLLQSQSTNRSGAAWSLVASPVLDHGLTYTVQAEQGDQAGNVGVSSPHTFSVPYTLLAAGDIASCSTDDDAATAAQLAQLAGTVAPLGDDAYESGTATEFSNCYGPTWGVAKSRTSPAVGNHEYATANASGYFGYFGAAAGDPSKGYYSYNLGASWHVIVLNTNLDCASVSCAAGSAQEQWLQTDLTDNTRACVVAYFHHPRFSSYLGEDTAVTPLWDDLYANGADLVLNGHAHNYERYAPQSPTGVATAAGIREIVAGTGGRSHHAFVPPLDANSVVHDDTTFGILQVTLNAGSYDWHFLPAPGTGTFTDSGTASCH
jgi:hypothetical protein